MKRSFHNQTLIGHWFNRHCLLEQAVEQLSPVSRQSAVEAERTGEESRGRIGDLRLRGELLRLGLGPSLDRGLELDGRPCAAPRKGGIFDPYDGFGRHTR